MTIFFLHERNPVSGVPLFFERAMASISTDTFRARPATWTVVRAGGC